jgi:hypothetical protein
MFPQLPEEMERMIWMKYFNYVLQEVRTTDSIWTKPSHTLFANTSDPGAIQIGHTELERRYDDIEPHSPIVRWILGYIDNISCKDCNKDCWYQKRGICQKEANDTEFEKHAGYWWDLSFYFNTEENEDW